MIPVMIVSEEQERTKLRITQASRIKLVYRNCTAVDK